MGVKKIINNKENKIKSHKHNYELRSFKFMGNLV